MTAAEIERANPVRSDIVGYAGGREALRRKGVTCEPTERNLERWVRSRGHANHLPAAAVPSARRRTISSPCRTSYAQQPE